MFFYENISKLGDSIVFSKLKKKKIRTWKRTENFICIQKNWYINFSRRKVRLTVFLLNNFFFTNLLIIFWNYQYVKSMFLPPSEWLIFLYFHPIRKYIRNTLGISLFSGNITRYTFLKYILTYCFKNNYSYKDVQTYYNCNFHDTFSINNKEILCIIFLKRYFISSCFSQRFISKFYWKFMYCDCNKNFIIF